MTAHDDMPSVEEDALASLPPAEPAPAQGADAAREDRIRGFIQRKQAAEALAARSAAEAQALRQGVPPAGRAADYKAPEDYTRAIAEQAAREIGAGLLSRQAGQAQEVAQKAAQEAWSEATAGFRQRVPDFDTVANNPNLAITPVMADAIRESARGAGIAYYLGKNPGEAANIASLPPLSQAAAIARLEGRLGSASVSVSRAPEPVGTLSGRGSGSSKPLEDMDFEEYRRFRGY
jgi:hypothetical protein